MWFATKGFKMVTIKVSKELNHKNRQSQLLGEKQNIKSSTCSLHCGRYSCLRATKDWRGHKIILHGFCIPHTLRIHLPSDWFIGPVCHSYSIQPHPLSQICREHRWSLLVLGHWARMAAGRPCPSLLEPTWCPPSMRGASSRARRANTSCSGHLTWWPFFPNGKHPCKHWNFDGLGRT